MFDSFRAHRGPAPQHRRRLQGSPQKKALIFDLIPPSARLPQITCKGQIHFDLNFSPDTENVKAEQERGVLGGAMQLQPTDSRLHRGGPAQSRTTRSRACFVFMLFSKWNVSA
ncbi:hypothetical protein EVAR_77702_1 [Eumeta japonica]|uniref:Uncharacterized protein n=1 Tax=Eumeta variegata TaxID=151549 RepID=A0A4C1TAL8_EUMVA|nr:hypothetical protein EVAR_77702_1 [Eumeta japonica]